MLARVTYGLVAAALLTLIGGFLVRENNILLYVSIGLSVAAIVLVLVGAARRAREAPIGEVGEPAFADVGSEEEIPEDVLEAFDELAEDEEFEEEEEEEEEFALEGEEDEEDFEFEEEEPAPVRRSAATKAKAKTKARPKPKPKAKAKPKPKAKTKAAAARSTGASRVIVVPGRDRYHTADCRFVKGKDDIEEVARTTAKRRGYEPCSVCSPD